MMVMGSGCGAFPEARRQDFKLPHWLHALVGCLLMLLAWQGALKSQTVYEPLHREVYDYLSRLSQRGVIEYDDLIKPLPRAYIAEKLREAAARPQLLTALEQQELRYFQQDFYQEDARARGDASGEIQKLHYLGKDSGGRYRLLSYTGPLLDLNLSPIYGIEAGDNDGKSQTHRWNGLYLYGRLGEHIGFSLDFRDNREEGGNIDVDKAFTPVTGVDAFYFPESNAIEYSEVHTTLAYDWSWGSVTLGKDFLTWGHERNGQLVLSRKAPSFPFVRLDVRPTDWLRFNYFHGWLVSNVADSAEVYPTLLERQNSFKFREKYLASHTLTATPLRGLDIALGESMVYSDRLEIAYLMPLMFFRLADHYLSRRKNAAGSNAQLFFALSSRNHIKNTHLYTTLFIDDLSVANVFNEETQINHVGVTFGASLTSLPLANLTLTAEYTRINPFVYKHFIPTELYTSSSYLLGHWMGHNADTFYGKLNYRLRRGLQLSLWGQKLRKGEDGEVRDQYTFPHKPFLFGLNRRDSYWGGEVSYEITHEFALGARYLQEEIAQELAEGGTAKHTRQAFYFSIYYGR